MTAPLIALTVLAGLGAIGLLVAILAGAWYVGYLQQVVDDARARKPDWRDQLQAVKTNLEEAA